MRAIILFFTFVLCTHATDFSKDRALRINAQEFNKKVKGRHVLPSPKFFLHQLKNMCDTLKDADMDFFLCHNLLPKQQYVLPILEHHQTTPEDAADVFMLELMPTKIYYHKEKPVAVTSAEENGQLRVLVPNADVPKHRLDQHLADILQDHR
jgi:hypothetical protein